MQRCFQSVQWLSNVSNLFYSKNRDLSKSDHVCGSDHVTNKGDHWGVDVAHQARKGYKTISKEFGLHKSSQPDCVQLEEIQDHGYLPEKWSTDQQRSLQSRMCNSLRGCKVPRVTSKQLKAFSHWLMLMFMSPPSGEHWATMVCMAELQEESHCSPKIILLAKDHVDKPGDYWRKV